MTATTLTEDDKGKSVVDEHGDKVGIITGVRGDTAYIDPDPGVTDKVKTMLGQEDVDQDDYPLDAEMIETVTDDEVRLQRAM